MGDSAKFAVDPLGMGDTMAVITDNLTNIAGTVTVGDPSNILSYGLGASVLVVNWLDNEKDGTIILGGRASAPAGMVVDGLAGFGTPGVETGTVKLLGDTAILFGSGWISTIDGSLLLYGPDAVSCQ